MTLKINSRNCSSPNVLDAYTGAWWLIGRFGAFLPWSRGFDSRFSRHLGTLGMFFTVALQSETLTQYPCCVRSACLWVVAELKRHYGNSLDEWMNESLCLLWIGNVHIPVTYKMNFRHFWNMRREMPRSWIVNSRFLQRPQKWSCRNQLIYRRFPLQMVLPKIQHKHNF